MAAPRGLSLDLHGTLLHLKRPVGRIWAEIASRHGPCGGEAQIEPLFRRSFQAAVGRGLVQHGDGKAFWAAVVDGVFGQDRPASVRQPLFDELYDHFATMDDWHLADGAIDALAALRADGWRVGVLSNGDDRVRTLVQRSGLAQVLDVVVLSGDVGYDKPDPRPFHAIASRLGVAPPDLVHIGDDPIADGQGAVGAGARGLVWGVDVTACSGLRSALHDR